MKFLAPLALGAALTSCGMLTNSVEWVDYGADPMQNPQYMEDMMAAGTPGPQHEALTSRAGTWNVAGKTWMGPGTEPMPMEAKARAQAILGGRYVVEDFRSDFMGMPFEGRLIQGYDNVTERYWSIWTDNMSTGPWISYGCEIEPGVLEYRGTAHDIMTPGGRKHRMTITDGADGDYTMRMYDTREGGGEFQTMELHYTRG